MKRFLLAILFITSCTMSPRETYHLSVTDNAVVLENRSSEDMKRTELIIAGNVVKNDARCKRRGDASVCELGTVIRNARIEIKTRLRARSAMVLFVQDSTGPRPVFRRVQ